MKQAKTTKRTAKATGKSAKPRSKVEMHDTPARQKRPAPAAQRPTTSAAKPAPISKADLRAQLEKLERANAKLKADGKERSRTVKDLESQVGQLRRELEAARATEAAAAKALDRLKARDKARRAEKADLPADSPDVPAMLNNVEDGPGGAGDLGGVGDESRTADERESAAGE